MSGDELNSAHDWWELAVFILFVHFSYLADDACGELCLLGTTNHIPHRFVAHFIHVCAAASDASYTRLVMLLISGLNIFCQGRTIWPRTPM